MLNNIICKKLFARKKNVFHFKKSYISLPFRLVRKEMKIKLDLPKNYGSSQYIRRLPYIRNEDPNFKNSVIDIVNNRSDLRKFLVATPVVTDGNFNQAVALRAPDQKNKGAFELPIPLSVMFKDAKKIYIQNPIIGNLLSQVKTNKISDAKIKQLLNLLKNSLASSTKA